jgi:hypothetical protein
MLICFPNISNTDLVQTELLLFVDIVQICAFVSGKNNKIQQMYVKSQCGPSAQNTQRCINADTSYAVCAAIKSPRNVFQTLGMFEYAPVFGKSVMKLAPTPIIAAISSTIWKGSCAGPSWRITACLIAGTEASITD